MMHSALARWTGPFMVLLFAPFLSTTASALSLVLTDGTNQLSCETVGQVLIQGSTLQAQVVDGCLGATSETTTGTSTLTVSKNGSGTVNSSPAGISCGSTCGASFVSGTSVTLTASAATDFTFESWSGCASTSGTSCTVSMGVARSVTASFSPASSSPNGDPGTGLWKPTTNTFVFDRTRGGSDNHVPGCIPNEYTNCQWGGSGSRYVSVKAGEVWSMRVPFRSHTGSYLSMPLNLAEAGANLSLSLFDVAITKTPGDFNTTANSCKRSAVSQFGFLFKDAVSGASLWGGCPLDRNTTYYFNVRPAVGTAAATQCGANSASHCRFRISNMFPSSAFSD